MSKEVRTPRYLSLVVPLKKVGDKIVYKELDDRMERAATTASSLEAEQASGSGPMCQDTILGDVDAQTRFEITSKQSNDPPLSRGYTLGSGEDINAVRHMLMLPVQVLAVEGGFINTSIQDGTDCLPTATIFEELARMGAKSTTWNEFSSTMDSLIIYLETNQKFNMSKYIFDAMLGDMSNHKKIFANPSHTKKVFANMKRAGKDFSGRITPLFDTMMVQASKEVGEDLDHPTDSNQIPIIDQPFTSSQPKQKHKSKRKQRKEAEVAQEETEHEDSIPIPSNDPLPSGEDSIQLNDLMVLCTKLQTQVLDLEKAKDAQAKEIADLKKRVQRLERKKNSRTTGLKRLRKVEAQSSITKDKGKAIMIKPEVLLKRKDQVAFDEDLARNLQAQLEVELIEEEKLTRKQKEEANIALIESWENTQAMMEADRLLAERLQTRER
ncbi:hypothetical protein Tco_1297660 [Tanacetum coccineum]